MVNMLEAKLLYFINYYFSKQVDCNDETAVFL